MLRFVDKSDPPKPAVRRPVTESLTLQIQRVEFVTEIQRVESDAVATNAPPATNSVATYAKPVATNDVATNKPVRTANRRTPEAYREYQRAYIYPNETLIFRCELGTRSDHFQAFLTFNQNVTLVAKMQHARDI